jgi:hypothetical protein
MAIARKGNPKWRIHPGEILREEYLVPVELEPLRRQVQIISKRSRSDLKYAAADIKILVQKVCRIIANFNQCK